MYALEKSLHCSSNLHVWRGDEQRGARIAGVRRNDEFERVIVVECSLVATIMREISDLNAAEIVDDVHSLSVDDERTAERTENLSDDVSRDLG